MSVRKSVARSHDVTIFVKDGLHRLLLHSVQSFLCSKFCSYCSYIMHNLSTSLCKKRLLHLHIMVELHKILCSLVNAVAANLSLNCFAQISNNIG